MQIEDLNIVARPRTSWQAVDLGILIAQRWYLPLMLCFSLPLVAVVLVCAIFIPDRPTLAVFIVWWFKPLYERIPLSFLSTSIFGDVPTIRQAFGRWRQSVLPGLLPALTYFRLSPTRSFKAPILVLEGLSGPEKSKRFKVLNASIGNEASWLTILCVHIEAFLNIGFVAFFALFIPAEFLGDIWTAYLNGLGVVQSWVNNLFYFISVILVGPFYVAAGFALYINRRVELEAWDIELGFRKIVRRLSHLAPILVLVCFTQLPIAPPAQAQSLENSEISEASELSKTTISEILSTDPYHQKETFSYPKFLETLDWSFNTDPNNKKNIDLAWLATVAEVCLWITAIALILWLIHRLGLLEKLSSRSPTTQPMPPPEKLFGIPLDVTTLPEDILGAAEKSWQSGQQRTALSLLLRGWLLQMINRDGCQFREGDTEADCLTEVRNQTETDTHQSFARLVSVWQHSAYAHQTTTEEAFEGLRADWQTHWVRSDD